MSTELECERTISVQIPWELIAQFRELLINRVGRKTTLPGFRKGKAPLALLYRYYEPEVKESILEEIVPSVVAAEIQKRDLQVVYGPIVQQFELKEGEPARISALVEIVPNFELGDYRGLSATTLDLEVSDELVAEELESMREHHASFQNLDPRPLRDGDFAFVSFESQTAEGETVVEKQEINVGVGQEATPEEYSEALRGLSPGETAEFETTFSDEYEDRNLAGLTLRTRFTVLGVRDRELPDLDDEFAKDVDSQFDSLEALRNAVSGYLQQQFDRIITDAVKEQLLNQLIAAHPMPLPFRRMVARAGSGLEKVDQAALYRYMGIESDDDEQRAFLEALARHLDPDDSGSDIPEEDLRDLLVEVERALRADFILDRIAQVEEIAVSPAETDAEIARFAQEHQLTPEAAVQRLDQSGAILVWQEGHRRAKTLDFLYREANIVPASDSDQETALPGEPPPGDAP